MSGLEALGVAASVIQVADLGTKLSVKLFSFYRQFKNADESFQLLSNEVALTSAILRELGDNLKDEKLSKLCSDEAFQILERVLDQCRDVLKQIERLVGTNAQSSKTRVKQAIGKVRLVLLEPSLNPLKSNLERLKSTMLLLLNVIMFAGQVRNQKTSIFQEQRALIETLLQEKEENARESSLSEASSLSEHNQRQEVLGSKIENPPKPNPCQTKEFAEVEEYNMLIRRMLREIDFCKSKLEDSRHSRIRKGVLSIHDSETVRFQLTHGYSVLDHIDKSLLVDENRPSETSTVCTTTTCAIYDNVHESVADKNPSQGTGYDKDPTKSPSHRHTTSNASQGLSRSAGRTTDVIDITSDHLANVKKSSDGHKNPQMRSVTLPIRTSHDLPKMDGQQQQNTPGLSPTQRFINLPPPPPPPPPSSLPSGVAYRTPTRWQQQQYWGRQALPPGFPPPPSPPLVASAQNQRLTYGHPPAPLSIIPPRHGSPPLVSATYVPGNDTIDVGIPRKLPTAFASGSPERPGLQSRKPFEPEFDFEENQVSIERTPQPQGDSDDDSDDGLFQVRPSRIQEQEKQPGPESEKKLEGPSLTLDTEGLQDKIVGFRTISTAGPSSEASDGPDPFFSTHGTVSPEDERPALRRDCLADFWHSRLTIEGVIDKLDDFFPDVDLDAPYLAETPSLSTKATNTEHDTAVKDRKEALPPILQQSPTATNSSAPDADTSTARPPDPGTVACCDVTRGSGGGGLSHMKSIRQVAQRANRTKSVSAAGLQRSNDLLCRNSTKMFGAKIIQIGPRPGSRIGKPVTIPQINDQTAPPTGAVLHGQPTFYIIRSQLIGKSTYGQVYLGMNANNGEVLAVKQVSINPQITDAGKDKELVAAIDSMQHLEHPNIVQYLGCERGEFSISIYLEYISGGSIGSYLREHGRFDECIVKSLTRQISSGLAYLHDKEIIHRDLKADNILLELDGTCKISGFGISKRTYDIYGHDWTKSMRGSIFWMAPEVIQGQCYTAKADIWSLGCIALQMFAGLRPWSQEQTTRAVFKFGNLGQAPPIPDDVSMNISPAALAFLYDCFTINSAERPTAGTLRTRHPFCELDPALDHLQTDHYGRIIPVLPADDIEGVELVGDKPQQLDISGGSSGGKLSAESNHEAKGDPHPVSPLLTKTSIALPENFEDLLLRWTKLGRNEIGGLGNPRSQIWTSVTAV